MILRTILLCRPCAAAFATKGIATRIVVDSVDETTFSLLGCPTCASHDLQVEGISRLDEPAQAPAAPAAAPPITPPAPAPPAAALPAAPAANDNAIAPSSSGARRDTVAARASAPPPIAPVVASSEEDAKALEAQGRKPDFIQLPSRVRCTAKDCDAELTFDVKERMADVLAREGWTSKPPTGARCAKHSEEETNAVATN